MWTLACSHSRPPPAWYRPGCFLSWPCSSLKDRWLPSVSSSCARRVVHVSKTPSHEVRCPFSANTWRIYFPETGDPVIEAQVRAVAPCRLSPEGDSSVLTVPRDQTILNCPTADESVVVNWGTIRLRETASTEEWPTLGVASRTARWMVVPRERQSLTAFARFGDEPELFPSALEVPSPSCTRVRDGSGTPGEVNSGDPKVSFVDHARPVGRFVAIRGTRRADYRDTARACHTLPVRTVIVRFGSAFSSTNGRVREAAVNVRHSCWMRGFRPWAIHRPSGKSAPCRSADWAIRRAKHLLSTHARRCERRRCPDDPVSSSQGSTPASFRLRRFPRPWRFTPLQAFQRVSVGHAHGVWVPLG